MFCTTLNRLQASGIPQDRLEKLLTYLGKTKADDEPLPLRTILDVNGLDDAIRALSAIDDCPELRLFAVRCVRESAQPLLTDPRSLDALDVAELYAVGEATTEELEAVRSDAWEAWNDALAGWDIWDAWNELDYSWAASAIIRVVEGDAAVAVGNAVAAARGAREAQRKDFIDIFCS